MFKKSNLSVAWALIVTAVLGFAMVDTPSLAVAEDSAASQQSGPPAMPARVGTVEPQSIRLWTTYSARLEAVDYAEIRPQVSGVITEVHFEDGASVEKGDVLFIIDQRPYKAAVDRAEAELKAARNTWSFADKEKKRAKELIKTNALSKRVVDERTSAANVAWAGVKSAEAALTQAKINLDYATVTAPISGRVSRVEMTEGNLVQAGPNAPLLTTVVSLDNIYADFDVDEATYLTAVRNGANGLDSEQTIPVRMTLADGSEFEGQVHSFDNRIDPSTGTIRARALFVNASGNLVPGMFATVALGSVSNENKILVTERAIGTNQDRKFVLVLDENDVAQQREVKLGERINGSRVVTSGLESGERIILGGLMKIRPNTKIQPLPAGGMGDDSKLSPSDMFPSEKDGGN